MSIDSTSTQDPRVSAFLSELPGNIQNFLQSPEFIAVKSRLATLGARYANSAGKKSGATLGGWSNFLVSSALHGIFIGLWSEFDLSLEVLFMKLTKLDPQIASIVCTPIQSGIRMQILQSLLNELGDEKGISLLKSVQEIASRNVWIHGFWDIDETLSSVNLYYRDAKALYRVKKKQKNWNDLANHLMDFAEVLIEVNKHFNVSRDEVTTYKKSIVAQEPVHESRAEHRRQSKSNSQKSKKKQPTPPSKQDED